MGWLKNVLSSAWSVGSSIPSLLSSPYGILIRLGLIAALAGGIFVYGYVKGGESAEAQLDTFRAGVDAAHKITLAIDAERTRLTDALLAEKDAKHDQDLQDAHLWWAHYVDGLQHDRLASLGAQPAPVESKICNDAARDHELSLAVRAAEQDLRRAADEYRAGLAPLLGAAEVQTADLVNLQDTWKRLRVINGAAP